MKHSPLFLFLTEFQMNRDQTERLMAEFTNRLNQLLNQNPNLTPDSLELKALIKEFNDKGLPVQIVRQRDIMQAAMSLMEMLSQMGMTIPTDEFENSRKSVSLGES